MVVWLADALVAAWAGVSVSLWAAVSGLWWDQWLAVTWAAAGTLWAWPLVCVWVDGRWVCKWVFSIFVTVSVRPSPVSRVLPPPQ